MHSSRMRTGRSLTVCWSLLSWGGLVPVGDVCSWGGVWLGGLLRVGVCSGGVCSGGLVWGVSAPGGVCLLPGGVVRGIYPSMH